MPSGRWPCTACSGFLGMFWVGIFAAGYPTGLENVDSSLGGQMMGIMTFFPLGFLPGYVIAWGLQKVNLLRVPPEVELRASTWPIRDRLLSGVRARRRSRSSRPTAPSSSRDVA